MNSDQPGREAGTEKKMDMQSYSSYPVNEGDDRKLLADKNPRSMGYSRIQESNETGKARIRNPKDSTGDVINTGRVIHLPEFFTSADDERSENEENLFYS